MRKSLLFIAFFGFCGYSAELDLSDQVAKIEALNGIHNKIRTLRDRSLVYYTSFYLGSQTPESQAKAEVFKIKADAYDEVLKRVEEEVERIFIEEIEEAVKKDIEKYQPQPQELKIELGPAVKLKK